MAQTYTVVHSFFVQPHNPMAPLVEGTDGNFYGTTYDGGTNNNGTVFRMDPAGNVTVIHDFLYALDGGYPMAGLLLANDGDLYGTTSSGGSGGWGTLFRIDTLGDFLVIANLNSFIGYSSSPLIQGSDGWLYGGTNGDGSSTFGTILRIRPSDLLFEWIYVFSGGADGANSSNLIQASDGNFYGTTNSGGTAGKGTAFRIDTSGNLTTLFSFGGAAGESPEGGVIQGTGGNLYGTTTAGGANGLGVAYEIDASGNPTILHDFNGSDGSNPGTALLEASDGNFYGTTYAGGSSGAGTLFQMDASGTLNTLYSFPTGTYAPQPSALIQASDGNLYGTTAYGGASNAGTAFSIDLTGNFATLNTFGSSDGERPVGGPMQASDGNVYGTTAVGGGWNAGSLYRVDPGGNLSIIYSFTGGSDGGFPEAPVLQASDGNLYGVTSAGGSPTCPGGCGTVFRLDPAGNLSTLHTFIESEGADSISPLIQGSDGNFYGTASQGGAHGLGTVFMMDPAGNVTTLYSFASTDGAYPGGGVVQGPDGAFYGTTSLGGGNCAPNGCGTVFRVDSAGFLTTLYDFTNGVDGGAPGNLVLGADGYLYGTTAGGGSGGQGTVLRVDTQGNLTTIHSFTGSDGGAPGGTFGLPGGSFFQSQDGFLYGTTHSGGAYAGGTLFQMDTSGNLATLHDFGNGSDGTNASGLVRANDCNFYGITESGGQGGGGVVFKLPFPTPAPSASNSGPVCEGAALQLYASTVAGAAYSWTGPNGFSSSQQNPTIPSVTVADSGLYSVTATVSGCTSSPATTSVSVNPAPVANASGSASICNGQATPLAGSGGVSCSWSPATGLDNPNSCTPNASPASTITYTLTVTDSLGCASLNAPTVTVTVLPLPTPTITPSGATTFCAGGSVTLDAGAGYAACLWSPGGETTQTIAVSASGSYSVTVTGGNGCQGTSAPTTVTVNPDPAPVITVSHCLTPNTSGQTASVPANTGDTYNWTITGGTIDSGQGTDTISFTSGGPATLMTLGVTETTVAGCTGNAADSMQVNFNDVPASNPFYTFVCTIARHAITAGCGGGNFCPLNDVLRSQMAVFILRGEHGTTYLPPPATGIFSDVLPSNPFAPWIEELYNEQITGGCNTNPLMYCPNNSVTRSQMAVFLLVAEHGTGYVPPACAGIFIDVACPGPFTNWIEELYNEGITGGCQGNPLLYCPLNSVARAQMAVFLTVTFNLQ